MYIIILISSLLSLVFERKRVNSGVYFSILIILVFTAGFRGENIGIDTPHYWDLFERIGSGQNTYIREPGYVWFVTICYSLGLSQQFVFFVYSFLTVFLSAMFIKKYSIYPMMSLFIFIMMGTFYLNTFNQVRQYLALGAFSAISLPFLIDRKFIYYIVSVVIISIFGHLSIILMLPFYFVLNFNYSLVMKGAIFLLIVLLGNLLIYIISLTPYAYFVLTWEEAEKNNALMFIQLIFSFVILLYENKIKEKYSSPEIKVFFNMTFFSFVIISLVFLVPEIPRELLTRLNNYFFIAIILTIPLFFNLFNHSSRIIIKSFFVLILVVYYVRNVYFMGDVYELYPFEFNFNLLK